MCLELSSLFLFLFLSLNTFALLYFLFSLPNSLNFLCFLCMFFVSARFSQIWLQVQTCIPSWWQHLCDKFLGCSCLVFSTSEPPCQFLLCGSLHNLIFNQIQKTNMLVKFKRCSFSSWVSSLICHCTATQFCQYE